MPRQKLWQELSLALQKQKLEMRNTMPIGKTLVCSDPAITIEKSN